MDDTAQSHNKRGLKFLQAGKYQDAIESFTRAIELDPSLPDPYHNRGETHLLLNRIVEGNTDIQRAKDIRSGKLRLNKPDRSTSKISISEVESIYDSIYSSDDDESGIESLDFDDNFYDTVFSDDTIESNETWDAVIQTPVPGKDSFPAILEFLGGKKLEVAGAILFRPTADDVSLTRQDGHVERVIPLEKIACIRIAQVPQCNATQKDAPCNIEIIETIDGNIFHEAILAEQDRENVVIGLSTKKKTPFGFTVIPAGNISKRFQKRYLGDILLEKRFIASDILKGALNEHQQTRNMKLGRIIAQQAQLDYTTIENELEKAHRGDFHGLKTGEILLFSGLVNEEQILKALETQDNLKKTKIGEFLIEKGIISEKEVYIALAEKFRIPFVDLRKQKVSKKLLTFLPKKFVLQNEVLPISLEDGTLTVATKEPDFSSLCETIRNNTSCEHVRCVLVQPTHLTNIINLLFKKMGIGQ